MSTFIGRKRELSLLEELLKTKIANLVVIKGRRRIGKSRLIEEFGKNLRTLVLTGLPPDKDITAQDQRDEFARQMASQLKMPKISSEDWGDLFWHLANQTRSGRTLILLDEISWMGSKDHTFLGKLKNAWDLEFKQNNKLILVLCGSISSWIEKNILSSTGFVGRINLILPLEELTLPECNEFWGSRKKQLSPYEKFKILSVTGGVPRYLELISPNYSAEENIKRLCFIKEGLLFSEFEQIFNDLFAQRSPLYKAILQSLIKYPLAELNDIFKQLDIKKSGTHVEYLQDIEQAGFISRDYSWSIKNETISKLSRFRISDNYIRFYLRYILPNKNKILRGAFEQRSLSTLPGWESIMGLQFENLVLKNRLLIYKFLHIDPNEIVQDNPYFQKASTKQSGCQIDYLIQTRFNCLYLCEIKFSKHPVMLNVVEEMKKKIHNLAIPKHFSYRPVLIHVNGVHEDVIESEFFAHIIDFADFLESK